MLLFWIMTVIFRRSVTDTGWVVCSFGLLMKACWLMRNPSVMWDFLRVLDFFRPWGIEIPDKILSLKECPWICINSVLSLGFHSRVHDWNQHSQWIKMVFWLFWRCVIAIRIVTVKVAGLPQTVRRKDTEEVWTVDLRTMASNMKKIGVISQGPVRNWASSYLPHFSHQLCIRLCWRCLLDFSQMFPFFLSLRITFSFLPGLT